MNSPTWLFRARLLALVAGGMDTLTGVGLVTAPALTLRAMLVPVPGPEALLYVRFVGAFVAAVGASYLLALPRPGGAGLREVFRFTLAFRAAAGAFTAGAVLAGALAPAWLVVTATDFALVALQVALLRTVPDDGR